MKHLFAAVLMFACCTAPSDARSFNSIIRAQGDADTTQEAATDGPAAACEVAPSSILDMILAFFSGDACENVSSLSNIDTALQLGPR